jgi:hypothetical protein
MLQLVRRHFTVALEDLSFMDDKMPYQHSSLPDPLSEEKRRKILSWWQVYCYSRITNAAQYLWDNMIATL